MDVVQTLQAFNTMIPTGNAKIGDYDYQVNANGMVPKVDQMDQFPIKVDDQGAPVYIRDVGRVEDSHQIQTNVVHVNGKRQVYIPIYRQPGANTIGVVEGIKRAIGEISARLPQGINLDLVLDQSVYVRKAIGSLEPVVLLSGIVRLLFTPLALSVTFARLASYVVALTVFPASCVRFLREASARGLQPAFGKIQTAYGRLLERILDRKAIAVIAVLAL